MRQLEPLPPRVRRLIVVGAGKAAPAMARAVESFYGPAIASGAVVTKYGHGQQLRHIECLEAAHPVPDEAGVEASRRIAELALSAGPRDLVLCLISGGASALLPFPVPGISLEEKQDTTQMLLSCGANIQELNCVRKHLSQINGGRLAQLAHPAKVKSLILSDVIGDPLDVIGSGPTVPDTTTFADAWRIVYQYGLERRLPASVRHHLSAGVNGQVPETPKPGDAALARVKNVLIGSNRLSLNAAGAKAQEIGYGTVVLTTSLDGEAREAGRLYSAIAREVHASGQPGKPPIAVLSGGETTVTLGAHHGQGGRNQEMALSAAIGLNGLSNTLFLAAGTDGTDGPNDAAGAFAFGSTVARAGALDLDPRQYLDRNDSHRFFHPLGDLLITGPTGTNVMDLHLLLIR